MESDGIASVTIIRTGFAAVEQRVSIAGELQPGLGSIYQVVVFPAGVNFVNVSFTLMDDTVAPEPIETLMFALSTIPGQTGTELGRPNVTIVRIMDDDCECTQTQKNCHNEKVCIFVFVCMRACVRVCEKYDNSYINKKYFKFHY